MVRAVGELEVQHLAKVVGLFALCFGRRAGGGGWKFIILLNSGRAGGSLSCCTVEDWKFIILLNSGELKVHHLAEQQQGWMFITLLNSGGTESSSSC